VRLVYSTFVALLLPFVGCGGKAEEYVLLNHGADAGRAAGKTSFAGAGSSSTAGVTSGAAASGSDAGGLGSGGFGAGHDVPQGEGGQVFSAAGEGGQVFAAGGAAGKAADGGAAGMNDAAGANAAAGAPADLASGCVSVTECPQPPNSCLTARCAAGVCVTDNVPAGALFVLDAPADCHATTACDGLGHPTLEVAQENAPTPNNECLAGTCNKAGSIGTEPVPSGSACRADFGHGKCDGKGVCVACLASADCPLGETCTAYHACAGQPCSATNCGGACPACVVANTCAVDTDCASNACDPETLLCVADHQCVDHRQDGNETDTDCGGGLCPLCGLGQACLANLDCITFACDLVTLTCVANTCVDHRLDSDESDLDCGGTTPSCSLCGVGKKCHSNFDCVPGHFCNSSPGGVCQ